MNSAFWLFGSFAVACLFIGVCSSKSTRSFEGYSLSKGAFSVFALVSTVTASFVGGGVVIGTAEKAARYGLLPAYGLFGFVLQLFVTGLLLAKPVSKMSHVLTVGELFKQHYGFWAKRIVGFLWILMGVGVVAANVNAMGQIVSEAFSCNFILANILGGALLLGYSVWGGIRAVVFTDVLQFMVMAVVIPFMLVCLVSQVGFDEFSHVVLSSVMPEQESLLSPKMISTVLGFMIGDALIPPVLQRLMMCNSSKEIVIMTIVSCIWTLIFILCAALIGIAVSTLNNGQIEGKFLSLLSRSLPDHLKPVCYLGLFATVISSADSYLNSLSVSCADDLFREKSSTQKLHIAKMSTLYIGLGAILISIFVPNVYDMLLFSYKFWGPVVFVPLIGVLSGKLITKIQLATVFASSSMVVFLWNVFDVQNKTGYIDLLPGTVMSFVLYIMFYRRNNKILRQKFGCRQH